MLGPGQGLELKHLLWWGVLSTLGNAAIAAPHSAKCFRSSRSEPLLRRGHGLHCGHPFFADAATTDKFEASEKSSIHIHPLASLPISHNIYKTII